MHTYTIYLLLLSSTLFGQPFNDEFRGDTAIRIGFYNVENLFDTQNDPLKKDDAFTPEGDYRWTEYRLRAKTTALAKVIRNMGGWEPIEVLGMCEVENRFVLEKLISHPILANVGYQIAHIESPDWRGIDVAAIYRADKFTLLYQRAIPVTLPNNPNFTTRDILYLKGLAIKDTIHLFFNHWPSRYGGQMKSEPNRIAAAQILRTTIDSITQIHPKSNVIVMGDFNDEWDNISIRENLGAGPAKENPQLINLMPELPSDFGTHRFQGVWAYLDQIIVVPHLLNLEHSLYIRGTKAHVFREKYLLEKDEKYAGLKPFRMYSGFRYQGGYSDHLPIYVDVVKNTFN